VRYYDLQIDGGATRFKSVTDDNRNNPNALRVQFMVEKADLTDQRLGSYIRVSGVTLDTLKRANNFAGKNVRMEAGFWYPSIPLGQAQAQWTRRGMIVEGTVRLGFGNWRGNDITLDLVLDPGPGEHGSGKAPDTSGSGGGAAAPLGQGGRPGPQSAKPGRLRTRRLPSSFAPAPSPRDGLDIGGIVGDIGGALAGNLNLAALGADFSSALEAITSAFGGGGFRLPPVNLIHNMQPGQFLGDAIKQTINAAFPGVDVVTLLSSALKLNFNDSGFYQSLSQYTGYLKTLSSSLMGGPGISVFAHGKVLTHTDWTQPGATVQLDYTDLIGQPTWVGPDMINFSSVLRADLIPPCTISLPETLFATAWTTNMNMRDVPSMMTTFTGTFLLYKVRHIGDSRSPDGSQWRTDCWAKTSSGVASSPQNNLMNAAQSFYNVITGSFDAIQAGGVSGAQRADPSYRFAARRQRKW
jgi:hypothetical protein